VLQDSFLDLFDSGHLDFATATSIRFSPEGFKRFYDGVSLISPFVVPNPPANSSSPPIVVGELPLQAPPPLTTSLQLARNHPPPWSHRYEHARRSRYLRARQ
jgi:hypothetical protein